MTGSFADEVGRVALYLGYAEEVRRQARSETDESTRRSLEMLADNWQRLAEQVAHRMNKPQSRVRSPLPEVPRSKSTGGNRTTGMPSERCGREVLESLNIHPDIRTDDRRMKLSSVLCALKEVILPGDYAQFGVYRGKSARQIASCMTGDRKLHLFDSFEGLPEDWTKKKKAGMFKLLPEEIPAFDSERVVVHKGWFKDTVPPWAREMTAPLAFIHLDADLYSSTIDVLFNTDHLMVPGTILLFDEYVMGDSEDEHRALVDWAAKFNRKFEYLWRAGGNQVCVRVTGSHFTEARPTVVAINAGRGCTKYTAFVSALLSTITRPIPFAKDIRDL